MFHTLLTLPTRLAAPQIATGCLAFFFGAAGTSLVAPAPKKIEPA
jgi:hypothetical protein